jgi:hypothetical protein
MPNGVVIKKAGREPRPTKKIYAVIYELKDKSRDYTNLYSELKKNGYMHYLESGWLISTDETPTELANRLHNHMGTEDLFIVIEVIKNYDGWLPPGAWDWIKNE